MNWEVVLDHWQVPLICLLMIVGAVIDGWKLKVPNWLTFTMILSGWAYWATQGWEPLGLSFLGAFVAGGLLILPYAIGGMGAGDVKMYAGFGAWMVPLPWFAFDGLLWAFAISVLVGGVLAVAMITWKRSYIINLVTAQEIMDDLKTSGSLEEINRRAKKRKPTLQLLPYGIPLTMGSLAYVAYVFPWNPVAAG